MTKIIVTHDGKFHADDVCAVAALSLAIDEPVEIIRTRDPEIIAKADFVTDVGGIHNPEANRFDHHQEGGAGVRPNGIPYAAFGLVWKTYGEKLCGGVLNVAEVVEVKFVEPLDAADNGVDIEVQKIENVSSYGFDSMVDAFVSTWKEVDRDTDAIFHSLVDFAKALIAREIMQARAKEEARIFVEDAYKEAEDKRIIIVDAPYPVRTILAQHPEPLFFVRPQYDGSWYIGTVRDNPQSFENRKSFPKAWGGKIGEELENITGVKGAVFCHRGLFMMKTRDKESAVKLAQLAVDNQEN